MLSHPDTERKGDLKPKLPCWGGPGAPLLPKVLREAWAEEPVPDWVSQDLGFEDSARISSLGSDRISGNVPERVLRYLVVLVGSRSESIRPLPTVDQPWPSMLSFADIPWRRRTRNCLIRHALHHRLADLPYFT